MSRDLGNPADHQSARGEKAREETLDGLGGSGLRFCDCSGRISDKLLPWLTLAVNVQSLLQSEA